jgi:fatty-acyl-CoA synthase
VGEVAGVLEAHVVGIPDPVRGEAIVAFVDADPEAVTPQTIQHHVRGKAAKYKAPQHVLYRRGTDLPRVASGKVPKAELRRIALTELGLDVNGMPAPRQTTGGTDRG